MALLTGIEVIASREEFLSVYQAGPDAMVAWVEELLATHAEQLARVLETPPR